MKIVLLDKFDWKKYSEQAHLVVFNEIRNPDFDRIDYAIVIMNEETPMGYATIRETDKDTCYLQYGGAFPSSAKTIKSYQTYLIAMNYLKSKYKFGTTLVENTNFPMLKMHMNYGWLIKGLRVFDNIILLEHQINFGGV